MLSLLYQITNMHYGRHGFTHVTPTTNSFAEFVVGLQVWTPSTFQQYARETSGKFEGTYHHQDDSIPVRIDYILVSSGISIKDDCTYVSYYELNHTNLDHLACHAMVQLPFMASPVIHRRRKPRYNRSLTKAEPHCEVFRSLIQHPPHIPL